MAFKVEKEAFRVCVCVDEYNWYSNETVTFIFINTSASKQHQNTAMQQNQYLSMSQLESKHTWRNGQRQHSGFQSCGLTNICDGNTWKLNSAGTK